jgi:hypothetical protein
LAGEIPKHVERFISDHIDSVELIEVLLLVKRSRDREWTAQEVSERLYTSLRSAAHRLEALRASRLVAVREEGAHAHHRYEPADAALGRAVDDLENVYAERRTRVINLIFSRPDDKIRTFADAFRIREDK